MNMDEGSWECVDILPGNLESGRVGWGEGIVAKERGMVRSGGGQTAEARKEGKERVGWE